MGSGEFRITGMDEPQDDTEALAAARTAFGQVARQVGTRAMTQLLDSAVTAEGRGAEGVTVPAGDGGFTISVTPEVVNLRLGEEGHVLSHFDARVVITELMGDQRPS